MQKSNKEFVMVWGLWMNWKWSRRKGQNIMKNCLKEAKRGLPLDIDKQKCGKEQSDEYEDDDELLMRMYVVEVGIVL